VMLQGGRDHRWLPVYDAAKCRRHEIRFAGDVRAY